MTGWIFTGPGPADAAGIGPALGDMLTWAMTEHLPAPVVAARLFTTSSWFIWLPVFVAFCLLAGSLVYLTYRLQQSRERRLAGETRLRLLQEGIQEAVLLYLLTPMGMPGRLVEANEHACRLLGYAKEDVPALTLAAILAPNTPRELVRRFTGHLAGSDDPLTVTFLARDGSRIPVAVTLRRHTIDGQPGVMLIARDLRDEYRGDEMLREARERLSVLMRAAPLAVISLDARDCVTGWNTAAESMFGWNEIEVLGHQLPAIPAEQHGEVRSLFAQARRSGTVIVAESRLLKKDGQAIDVNLSCAPLADPEGNYNTVLCIVTDLSDLKRTVEQLHWIHSALRILPEARRAIAHATEEAVLLHDICRIIVDTGGYRMSWVGLPSSERATILRPVAVVGYGPQYVDRVTFSWANSIECYNPTGAAFRTGNPVIARNLLATHAESPWLVEAINCGFGSVIALPLKTDRQSLGTLSIYAVDADAFDEVEVKLLSELADDLAFGLEFLRAREARQDTERELHDTARQWQSTFDAIADAVMVVDRNGHVVRCNDAVAELLGKSPQDILHRPCFAAIHGAGSCPAGCPLTRIPELSGTESEVIALADRWFQVSVTPLPDGNGNCHEVLHVMKDITEHRRADEELQQHLARLKSILDHTIAAIAKIVEMRDPYTAGHEQRVSRLACAIAEELGLPEARIEGLRVAGMLHDIGKLYVPTELLCKPTTLSDMETILLKHHAQAGYEILKTIDFPWPVAEMVYQHHERINGRGYPNGLSGDSISLEARILAVADVVEAMASHRPYRPARGMDDALAEIVSKQGAVYDPDVVSACVRLFKDKGYQLE